MGTTNILELNNRVDKLEKSYPADNVMMADGVTSVEDAVDELKSGLTNYISSVSYTGTTNSDGYISGSANTFGLPNSAIPLSVYFEKGSYSSQRKVDYYMFGNSGIAFRFISGDTPVANNSVTATIYYVIK